MDKHEKERRGLLGVANWFLGGVAPDEEVPRTNVNVEVKPRLARRKVSDEEMRAALADTNNTNVIRTVLQKFSNVMHADDLETCGMHALWRALQYHREEFGQKFTTSLYRFTDWECKRELRRQKNERKGTIPLAGQGDIPCRYKLSDEDSRDEMMHVRECMELLSREQRALLEKYFLDNMTMDEIGDELSDLSKEAVRQKLDKAVRRLRELCEEAADGV